MLFQVDYEVDLEGYLDEHYPGWVCHEDLGEFIDWVADHVPDEFFNDTEIVEVPDGLTEDEIDEYLYGIAKLKNKTIQEIHDVEQEIEHFFDPEPERWLVIKEDGPFQVVSSKDLDLSTLTYGALITYSEESAQKECDRLNNE